MSEGWVRGGLVVGLLIHRMGCGQTELDAGELRDASSIRLGFKICHMIIWVKILAMKSVKGWKWWCEARSGKGAGGIRRMRWNA